MSNPRMMISGGEPDPHPLKWYPGWGYHITGAVNLPYNELYETGDDGAKHMKNVSALKTLMDDIVATDNVLYCHSTRRSSYTYFAFRLMGYNARNYDDRMKIWTDVIDTKYRYSVFPCSAECA